ncbi:MAG: aspartyl/asparaginyl beta-hydroxylase domain-containing protein [Rhodobacter sp.]|nr:aspartyl/asparaginyl beta-hydroxylase domain-containing protein [Paracoccaceae bacterium]MCC0077750.1 aspartyl/asparaginyl beta-hydroxylase domain-containing protein [Rhodobacter sp.]
MATLAKRLMTRGSAQLRRLYADIDTPPVLDVDRLFPAHHDLESRFDALRAEALAVYNGAADIPRFHDITATQARISANDGKNWRMFLVKSYGHVIQDNAARTPELARFLRANPQVTTAAISYLDPGKHIPAHRGPFRGILRYHLCLFAPDAAGPDGPWLQVDQQRIPYREGADLLWDDTYLHEVLNPGPHPRIALLLDIRRPVDRYLHRALFRWVMIGGRLSSRVLERRMRVAARR